MSSHLDRAETLAGAIIPLVGTVVAMAMVWQRLVTWRDVSILLGMYFFTGIGVTVGFHRMLTHRSFQAHPIVRFILLALGSIAGHTDPVRWVSIHIQHHARSDAEGDPHSPLEGLFHAHFGWIYAGINPQPEIYGTWLLKDRMVLFFQRTFVAWLAAGFVVPYWLGGWDGLLWGGLVRMFLSHHITWSVNSICHTFGQRTFETGDRSTNQWLVGLLALGEGWHNNHHAFPRSAMHGLRWWQIDLSAYVIILLEWLGLVWEVQRVPRALQEARMARDTPAKPAATTRRRGRA
jgi:stearoyl-CoA desaturase (delta-9 desaturase)